MHGRRGGSGLTTVLEGAAPETPGSTSGSEPARGRQHRTARTRFVCYLAPSASNGTDRPQPPRRCRGEEPSVHSEPQRDAEPA